MGDLVGADVLGDAAGLGLDDLGLADGVEQRGLAVVDVAHDGDHRRARGEVGGIVDELVGSLLLLFGVLDLHLRSNSSARIDDGVIGQRLGDGDHLAQLEQRLDELARAYLQGLAQILDAGAALDLRRRLGARRDLLLDGGPLRLADRAAAPIARPVPAFAAGLRVDDDPAPRRLVVAPAHPGWPGDARRGRGRGGLGRLPPTHRVPGDRTSAKAARGGRPCRAAEGRRPGAGAGRPRRVAPPDGAEALGEPRASGCTGFGGAAAAALRAASARASFSAWMRAKFFFAHDVARRLDPFAQRHAGTDDGGHILETRPCLGTQRRFARRRPRTFGARTFRPCSFGTRALRRSFPRDGGPRCGALRGGPPRPARRPAWAAAASPPLPAAAVRAVPAWRQASPRPGLGGGGSPRRGAGLRASPRISGAAAGSGLAATAAAGGSAGLASTGG